MRWSQMFIPTLKEDPSEAEVPSHKLMLRAGLVRALASGIYSYLPLGQRACLKATAIVREEMNAIGAQEFYLPALNPLEIWEQTGRNAAMGNEMFRLKDRKGRELCLAPTHEEIMCWIAKDEIRSYRDLPQMWYQIQTKFRDEPRPRSGVLRTRQFTMKDSYSLSANAEELDAAYDAHSRAYHRIFTRAGLDFFVVNASSGLMGGSRSQEFMAPSDAGEDTVARGLQSGYAANVEIATSAPAMPLAYDSGEGEVATPNMSSVSDVAKFLGAPTDAFLKTLVFVGPDGKPFIMLMRGTDEVVEAKLQGIAGGECRPAAPDEIPPWFNGAHAGSLGPMGATMPVYADLRLKDAPGTFLSGANKDGFHVRGIRIADLPIKAFVDARQVFEGEPDPISGEPLVVQKAIEIGHIFKLGTKYSDALGATFLDAEGAPHPIIMGSYGIGIERIVAVAIEQSHDANGIIWPRSLAPFEVVVSVLNWADLKARAVGESLYQQCRAAGIDVLVDDRDVRAGVKMKDADLIGIPWRVTVGDKGLARGIVEVRSRKTGESTDVVPDDVAAWLKARFTED